MAVQLHIADDALHAFCRRQRILRATTLAAPSLLDAPEPSTPRALLSAFLGMFLLFLAVKPAWSSYIINSI